MLNTLLNTDEVIKYPDAEFQAGVALIDTKTGEIRAIGGGRNQEVKRGFNYAIDTQRQPGSTIKPVLIMVQQLNISIGVPIKRLRINQSSIHTGQKFGNWNDKYMGPISMRTALQLSQKYNRRSSTSAGWFRKGKRLCHQLRYSTKGNF